MRRHGDEIVCLGNFPSTCKLKKIKPRSDGDSGSAMVNLQTWSQDISPFLLSVVLETKEIQSSLYWESFYTGAHSKKLWFRHIGGSISACEGERKKKHIVFIRYASCPLENNFMKWSNTTHTHRLWIIHKEAICILCSLKFVLLLGISVFFFHLQNISVRRKLYVLNESSSP